MDRSKGEGVAAFETWILREAALTTETRAG